MVHQDAAKDAHEVADVLTESASVGPGSAVGGPVSAGVEPAAPTVDQEQISNHCLI